jgi:LysM repeat protein
MHRIFTALLALFCLSACVASPTSGIVTSISSAVVPSSLAPTDTVPFSPSPTPFLALTQAALPSPTPVTYTVVLNDTLITIANKFGVTLDALMAANPGVNPNALTVGTVLVIPVGGALAGQPTPTPASLIVRQTRCYPTADGGMWCLALVENPFAESVENLSALFTLIDASGQELSSQVGYSALDIIPPGRSMPLGVFFPAPVSVTAVASLQLLTAIRILPGDQRYLPATVRNTLVQVDWDGRLAQVSGQVHLESGTAAKALWVLAVAYAADGSLVGYRRWEATGPLTGDVPFSFSVHSLAGGIERVEFILEARP